MAVQLNTESLSKAHQFIWEACKILWQHKKVFFAFAALPMMLDVVENVFADKSFNPILTTFTFISNISLILKWFIALPLFSIAWFRYLLDATYKANLTSYFSVDQRMIKLMVWYFFCLWGVILSIFVSLFCLLVGYGLSLSWKKIKILKGILNILDPIPSLITLNGHYLDVSGFFIPIKEPFIVIILLIFSCLLPYLFKKIMPQLPSLTLNKPLKLFSFKTKALPNYKSFLWSIILLIYLTLTVPAFLSFAGARFSRDLNFVDMQYYQLSIPINLIASILGYIIIGIILTSIALYYNIHIAKTLENEYKKC